MQFIYTSANPPTLNQVDFYTGFMHSYSDLVSKAIPASYDDPIKSTGLATLNSSNFYFSNPNGLN
jgi:hypothetical protein